VIVLFSKIHQTYTKVDPPDSVTIGEFMRNEIYGRYPVAKSRNPFTCGLTGKTFTLAQSWERSDLVAKALSKIMGWEPNADSPWDKVIAIFSFNTVSKAPVLFKIKQIRILLTAFPPRSITLV
jgi:hypothetical protein